MQFFAEEKWRIASDRRGSGNTANIGSINKIEDILSGNGMFSMLGEEWFDDYWMNYGKITVQDDTGKTKKITNLYDFVVYRGGDTNLIIPRTRSNKSNIQRKFLFLQLSVKVLKVSWLLGLQKHYNGKIMAYGLNLLWVLGL